MVLGIIALLVSSISVILTIKSLLNYLTGRSFRPVMQEKVKTIVAAKAVSPQLLRSLVASGADILVATVPNDKSTKAVVEEVRRELPSASISITEHLPPVRHVVPTWLTMMALKESEQTVLVDHRARPTSRQISPLLVPGYTTAACPVTPPRTRSFASKWLTEALSFVTPYLYAACGPISLPPVLMCADREAVEAARCDPLAANRPSFVAAVAIATRGVLIPSPVGFVEEEPFRSSLFRLHLLYLSRLAPLGTWVVILAMMAVPLSLTTVFFNTDSSMNFIAFLLAISGRTAMSFSWTREVEGVGRALSSLVLSPIQDAFFAAMALIAVSSPWTRIWGVPYRVQTGGLFTPFMTQGG